MQAPEKPLVCPEADEKFAAIYLADTATFPLTKAEAAVRSTYREKGWSGADTLCILLRTLVANVGTITYHAQAAHLSKILSDSSLSWRVVVRLKNRGFLIRQDRAVKTKGGLLVWSA